MLADFPLLLCVNLQSEFVAFNEPQWIADSAKTIELCRAVQSEWRAHMWPIAHLRRIASAAYFNSLAGEGCWIDRVKPLSSELVFEHSLPSAYSSARYREYMQQIRPKHCVVVGLSLNDSIISTVIDGFHRGDSFSILGEAVSCNRCRDAWLKTPTLAILNSFARVTPLASDLQLSSSRTGSSPDRSPSDAIQRP